MPKLNPMRGIEQRERRKFFKLIACDCHTWPILGCEACFNRIHAKLEEIAYEEADFS